MIVKVKTFRFGEGVEFQLTAENNDEAVILSACENNRGTLKYAGVQPNTGHRACLIRIPVSNGTK